MQHRYFSPELLDTVCLTWYSLSPRLDHSQTSSCSSGHFSGALCAHSQRALKPFSYISQVLFLNSYRHTGRPRSLCEHGLVRWFSLSPPVTPCCSLVHPCCLSSRGDLRWLEWEWGLEWKRACHLSVGGGYRSSMEASVPCLPHPHPLCCSNCP